MKIIKQQRFNIDFFEFSHDGSTYRIGIGNYKNSGHGCEMFYPESGSDYILVIYNNGWYTFDMNEFTHTAGIYYIAKKLKCSKDEAFVIHGFIASMLKSEAAKAILIDEPKRRNPFIPG